MRGCDWQEGESFLLKVHMRARQGWGFGFWLLILRKRLRQSELPKIVTGSPVKTIKGSVTLECKHSLCLAGGGKACKHGDGQRR